MGHIYQLIFLPYCNFHICANRWKNFVYAQKTGRRIILCRYFFCKNTVNYWLHNE